MTTNGVHRGPDPGGRPELEGPGCGSGCEPVREPGRGSDLEGLRPGCPGCGSARQPGGRSEWEGLVATSGARSDQALVAWVVSGLPSNHSHTDTSALLLVRES